MNYMKKSVFAVCVVLVVCCLTVVSAAAIDTPWVPITPDSEETDTTEIPTESTQNSTNETQSPQGDRVDSSEQNETMSNSATEQKTDTPTSSEPKNGGCSSSLNGCQWIVATVCAAWGLCLKTRRKKEVNG